METADVRRDVLFLEHAVDSVAQAKLVFVGLDVNVGGPPLDRLDQDLVDEADDGGVLGLPRGVQVVLLVGIDHLDAGVCAQRLERIGPNAQEALQRPVDLGGWRQGGDTLAAGGEAQLVERARVARPRGGDKDQTIALLQRQHVVAHQQAHRKLGDKRLVRRHLLEVDVRNVQRPRQEAQQRFLAEAIRGEKRLLECLPLRHERAGSLLRGWTQQAFAAHTFNDLVHDRLPSVQRFDPTPRRHPGAGRRTTVGSCACLVSACPGPAYSSRPIITSIASWRCVSNPCRSSRA